MKTPHMIVVASLLETGQATASKVPKMSRMSSRLPCASLIVIVVAIAAGCGSDAASRPDAGAGAEAGAAEAGIRADRSPLDPGGGQFTLTVVNGYGSGVYGAGQTVHVWSSASTTNEVALPWTGDDASQLKEPEEWHSSLVMPARNVSLVANKQGQTLTLTIEQYQGSTGVAKSVRYYLPPSMRGVVIFSHGTGGSSTYIESPEAFALALALVRRGYGVLGTEAEEAAAGDLNGDGKERWITKLTADNVDSKNLQLLFAALEKRGLIPAGTPKFALGMSAGGSFSHFLGTLGASPVASSFPQLRFKAVVSYCADATAAKSATLSATPSAWFMCGAEDNPEVSNQEARANELALRNRGIPTDYAEHPPSPLYSERFTRIAGISATTSAAMVSELRAAKLLDAAGFVTTDGDEVASFILGNPASFPTILAQTEAQGSIRSQVKAVRAEHAMYADYTQRNIAFFDRFNLLP